MKQISAVKSTRGQTMWGIFRDGDSAQVMVNAMDGKALYRRWERTDSGFIILHGNPSGVYAIVTASNGTEVAMIEAIISAAAELPVERAMPEWMIQEWEETDEDDRWDQDDNGDDERW